MQSKSKTIYFDNVGDAREAQDALSERGVSAELHTDSSEGKAATGGGFLESVREFFGAAPANDSDRSNGAFLKVDSADEDALSIVRRYGGQTSDSVDSSGAGESAMRTTDEQRMRVHEERLNVDKERVSEGEFRAHKEVVTEQQQIDVPVTREEVYVERRAVNDGASGEDISNADEEIRIPVTHEEVHVEKRPVTTEEIIVGKRQVQETQTVGADVRKERVHFDSDVDVDNANVIDRSDS